MDVDQLIVQLRRERQFLEEAIRLLERRAPEPLPPPAGGTCRPRIACRKRERHGRRTKRITRNRGSAA